MYTVQREKFTHHKITETAHH